MQIDSTYTRAEALTSSPPSSSERRAPSWRSGSSSSMGKNSQSRRMSSGWGGSSGFDWKGAWAGSSISAPASTSPSLFRARSAASPGDQNAPSASITTSVSAYFQSEGSRELGSRSRSRARRSRNAAARASNGGLSERASSTDQWMP